MSEWERCLRSVGKVRKKCAKKKVGETEVNLWLDYPTVSIRTVGRKPVQICSCRPSSGIRILMCIAHNSNEQKFDSGDDDQLNRHTKNCNISTS